MSGFTLGFSLYGENIKAGSAKAEISKQAGPPTEDISLLILAPSITGSQGSLAFEAELALARSDAI